MRRKPRKVREKPRSCYLNPNLIIRSPVVCRCCARNCPFAGKRQAFQERRRA